MGGLFKWLKLPGFRSSRDVENEAGQKKDKRFHFVALFSEPAVKLTAAMLYISSALVTCVVRCTMDKLRP